MNKKYILPVLGLSVLLAGTAGALSASAAQNGSDQQPIVKKLAEKFNLKESDVQQVFDQDREEHKITMQKNFEDKLTQAVTDGKLTEAQKQLIITKQKELQTKRESERESLKDKTPEERKAQMESNRAEFEQWAKDNNIDLKYLRPMGPKGAGMHRPK